MRQIIALSLKDLRSALRDRSAFVLAILAPLGLTMILNQAFGGVDEFNTTIAVVDLDKSGISTSFIQGVTRSSNTAVEFKVLDTEPAAAKLIDEGEAGAAIIIPAGLERALRSGNPLTISVLRGTSSPISAAIASGIAQSFASPPSPEVVLVDGHLSARKNNPASFFAPSMSLFFLSFTVQFGAAGQLEEKASGTLNRLLASPLPGFGVVVGKSAAAFVLGMVSILVLAVSSSILFDAYWGPPLAVAVLGASALLAFMGVGSIGAAVSSTRESLSGFTAIVMMVFALLGGNFFRISEASGALQKVALATPNGWALRGFADMSGGAGLASISTPILALLGIATGCAAIAMILTRTVGIK